MRLIHILKTGITFGRTEVWYGIVEFNVPLDTVDHFGDGDVLRCRTTPSDAMRPTLTKKILLTARRTRRRQHLESTLMS